MPAAHHDETEHISDHDDTGQPGSSRTWWFLGGIGFLVIAIIVMVWLVIADDSDHRAPGDDQAPVSDAVIPNAAEQYGLDARSSMTVVPEPEDNLHEPYAVPEDVTVDAAGYTMKEHGEAGLLTAGSEGDSVEDEDVIHSLTVEDVRVSDQCMLRAFEVITAPEGEHFVEVDVTASVEEDIEPYIEADIEDYYMPLVHDAFALLDENGQRIEGYTETAFGCLDLDQRLDSFIEAGDEVSGTIVFDVQELPDRIAYDPQYVGGWSWEVNDV